MFFPISFKVLTAVLTVIHILLVFILSRVLMIYSKFGSKYANSIRWLQQEGYISMWFAALLSHRAPWRARLIMSLVLSVTVLVAFSGVILTHFATAVQQLGPPTIVQVTSNQSVQLTSSFYLPTWMKVIPYGDNITSAILSMVDTPANIPGTNSNVACQAHLSEYKSLCSAVRVFYDSTPVITPEESCMTLSMDIISGTKSGQWQDSVQARADGTVNVTSYGPTIEFTFEVSPLVQLAYGRVNSAIVDQRNAVLNFPPNSTSSPPSTVATKNWTPDGDMVILSMTTTRVFAGIESLHDTLKTQFGNNELFENIETSIQQSTFVSNATFNIMFSEIRASVGSLLSTLTTIKHVSPPHNSPILNTEGITNDVADLFGRLGYSMTMSWNINRMIIFFDAQRIFNGYEVPDWLAYTLGIFLVLFLLAALWTFEFEDKYTSSFFDLVHSRFVLKLGNETQSRLCASSFKHGLQLGDDYVAFRGDLAEGTPEDERYDSSTNFGRHQIVPGESGAGGPYAGGPGLSASSSTSSDIYELRAIDI
ncbi:hypothetical protein BG011_001012 [Mortierella polycephala]|uniref:Uncharacterized protein n=1 Tax=Mortierella polycephala TaxID=41804 RepID=A0A9P6PHJ4_9FUNG|nr:hypothetical protein BG011_001012 [Mortierella polycephala]